MKHTPLKNFDTVSGAALSDFIEAGHEWPVARLFGLPLVCGAREEMARHIVSRVGASRASTINFINAHCVNQQRRDREYRDALEGSDLLLPDGIGMEIGAKLCGLKLGENLNGTDLFPALCREAATQGTGIFLLGGVPGAADGAADWATTHFPALRVAGTHSGYFSPEEEELLIERINRSRAGILLVGFGVPLQEKWIARNRHRITAPVVMGVGGLFDYYSGRIPRAPKLVRACKSEWVWRLAMEPRRMAKRYIWGNAVFLAYAAATGAANRGVFEKLNAAGKRVVDVVLASLAIMALLPILIVTAFAIRTEDRGPVLFRQTRIGEDGRPFSMIKFRSMYTDAEERRNALLAQSERDGTCFKMRNDPRITRTGRFIRRFSIDELPQLFNVLGGSMSLVGPRPALPSEVTTYRGSHWQRLQGKPGITCTWQVRGRAEIPFERQAIMDRAYLKRTNLWVDLKLLLCTPGAVFSGRGAY
ncbi:WecB/TagA/CpsF family glycosyltransferase [Altererythrobacter ishigakiensis]|uniref:Exopolysaccharide biosynthesis WecB/TagA/CpsF family protein n=1 Tax=Altererythrobacter ishigakiensis TaxID=476157 RepID=A0A562ULN6_9SPHN|nr:WecB/TagA/CpsF family glycosyltransferase [Altererythrobacter ishigakiensis]TWJ06533.1 exopolysaccharide biosynthesis WecB/TagA/CpsF family protein [Altererythrobacter ishigakiensis]